jgi:hypothetical protein
VKADGKLGAVVMDDDGRMVTLHDLITRKGKLIAESRRPADEPHAAAGNTQAHGDTAETDWVLNFTARLADGGDLPRFSAQVSKAHADGIITARTASELHQAVSVKAGQPNGAAA